MNNLKERRDPIADGSLFTQRSPTKASTVSAPSDAHKRGTYENPQHTTTTTTQLSSAQINEQQVTSKSTSGGDTTTTTTASWMQARTPKSSAVAARLAIRNSFENLVRASPLPKVLQKQQTGGSVGQITGGLLSHHRVVSVTRSDASTSLGRDLAGEGRDGHTGVTTTATAPKAVRASLVPPPRFSLDADNADNNDDVHLHRPRHTSNGDASGLGVGISKPPSPLNMSPPKRQPLTGIAKLSLFDDWWIAPLSQSEPGTKSTTGFCIYGTEHSSFIEVMSSQRTEKIRRRLDTHLLLIDGPEAAKVKLIGRVNEVEMNKLYENHVTQMFATAGVPDNWISVLRSNLKKRTSIDLAQEPPAVDDDAEELVVDDVECHGEEENDKEVLLEGRDDAAEQRGSPIKVSPSKRKRSSERERRPIQRLGIDVGDDEACFCGSSRLMKSSPQKARPPETELSPLPERRGPGRPPASKNKTLVPIKQEKSQVASTSQPVAVTPPKKRGPGRILGSKNRPGSKKPGPKPKKRPPPDANANASEVPIQPKRRGPGRPPGTKNPPGSKKPGRKPKNRVNQDEQAVSIHGVEAFQRSRSGRRVVPHLDYWNNERIKYDSVTGEAIGVTASPDKMPGYQRQLKRKSPSKPSTSQRQEDHSHHDDVAQNQEQDTWTREQITALSMAQLQVDPTCRNFWQEVAKNVPGKSADDCFAKHFQKHPTPVTQKTKARTGSTTSCMDGEDDDRIVAHAPSAAVRKQMKHLRWKRLRKAPNGEMDAKEGNSAPQDVDAEKQKEAGKQNQAKAFTGEPGFRRSSRLQDQSDLQPGSPIQSTVGKEDQSKIGLLSPMGMTQALFGEGSSTGGKPKTLAAAIVSALAEVETNRDEDDEEEEDFYFDEDM